MQKLLLTSVLLASVALPMRAARDRSAVRGLRKTVLWTVAFNVLYLIAILYVYPRLP
jgi:hypothetical protein